MNLKSPKAFLIFHHKINSKQQNKQIASLTESLLKDSGTVPPQEYSFYQLGTNCTERQMSRKGMWEPRYSEGMYRTIGKPTNAKRDLQNHPSYWLLICDLRGAEKEAKMGFQS